MTSTPLFSPARKPAEAPARRTAGACPAHLPPQAVGCLEALLSAPGQAVVAVDFDGTLAPVVPDPAAARPLPRALTALTALARYGVRVAIVTGRPAGYVVTAAGLRAGAAEPPVTVLGHYGLQRWDSVTDELRSPAPHPAMTRVRTGLHRLVTEHGIPARIEDKTHSLCLHTRSCPDPAGALRTLEPPVRALADGLGLRLEAGRHALEVRADGVDKAMALAAFLAERPVRPVLYAGDDLADLPVARLLADRRAQGDPALMVYSAPASADEVVPALEDGSDLRVSGPAGVADLLTAVARALREGRP
ncbi:trehalose-phosphatase [Streptomyces sp. NPDC001817]|uniref:trehalose-phosphatase n=1 Tax=Streptomyces sp. NPDC001817 TaxID=3154398 RepID=UPI003320382C